MQNKTGERRLKTTRFVKHNGKDNLEEKRVAW